MEKETQDFDQPTGYIPDGYTREFYFEAVFNRYPAIRGAARPTVPQERHAILNGIVDTQKDPKKREEICAKLIAARLERWDLMKVVGTGDDRRFARVDFRNIAELARIDPGLRNRLVDFILGSDGGDVDPEKSKPPKPELADQASLDAAIAGLQSNDPEVEQVIDAGN